MEHVILRDRSKVRTDPVEPDMDLRGGNVLGQSRHSQVVYWISAGYRYYADTVGLRLVWEDD
jgi:hypothetical protein